MMPMLHPTIAVLYCVIFYCILKHYFKISVIGLISGRPLSARQPEYCYEIHAQVVLKYIPFAYIKCLNCRKIVLKTILYYILLKTLGILCIMISVFSMSHIMHMSLPMMPDFI